MSWTKTSIENIRQTGDMAKNLQSVLEEKKVKSCMDLFLLADDITAIYNVNYLDVFIHHQ